LGVAILWAATLVLLAQTAFGGSRGHQLRCREQKASFLLGGLIGLNRLRRFKRTSASFPRAKSVVFAR
jgi:hypothetical protein